MAWRRSNPDIRKEDGMRKTLLLMGTLGLAIIAVFALLFVTGNFTPNSAKEWAYIPRDVTEAEMLGSLKPASADIKAVVQRDAAASKELMIIAASKRVYVATRDVALGRVDDPITVILPSDVYWTGGQLGKVVLLRAEKATPQAIGWGYAFVDPMCEAEFIGIAVRGVCLNVEAQRPGTWDNMLTHMRRPTEPELKKWLGKNYVPGNATMYYVATSDFVAAPEYKFYDTPGETLGIFVPPGIQVLGGQLGYLDLLRLSATGVKDQAVTDSLCFMNDSPVIWDEGPGAGQPNYAKPSTFAPDVEVQRVSACTRPK